jgi:hypothetical protein
LLAIAFPNAYNIKEPLLLLGTLLPLLLIAIPLVIHLWFVRAYAVSLPFWDEWEFWWSMKGFDEGNWHHAFWIPHNEHRLVVTRVVYHLLRYTTGLNVTVAMYFNVLLAGLTLWGLWQHLSASVKPSLWYFVPVAYVALSLEQWENMLWGWQIAIYAMVCSSVWSLYWLSRPGRWRPLLAIAAAVVSSLSFVNGLMIWPVGAVYLFLARSHRKRWLAWCGAAAVTFFVYFRNYVTQVTRPSPTALVRPTSLAEFFEAPLSVLGNDPLSLPAMIFGNVGALLAPQSLPMAIAVGIVVSGLFLITALLLFRLRKQWATMPLSLVALALLSFMSSLTIIGGRMGYWDAAFVLSSRYTTMTILGIVATYLLAVAIANSPQQRGWTPDRRYQPIGMAICGLLCLLYVVGLPGGYRLGLEKGEAWRTERLWQRQIVQNFEILSDEELSQVYPKTFRERLLYWKRNRLEPFNP